MGRRFGVAGADGGSRSQSSQPRQSKQLIFLQPVEPRFLPGAGNRHRSEPEPVEPERETEPPEPEPDRTGTEPNRTVL